MSMWPKCKQCQRPLTNKEVTELLGRKPGKYPFTCPGCDNEFTLNTERFHRGTTRVIARNDT